jgi:hypothetical protein
MTTFNVFAYFWDENLVGKGKHFNVKFITLCHIWAKSDSSSSSHAEMFTFGRQNLTPKECETLNVVIHLSVVL